MTKPNARAAMNAPSRATTHAGICWPLAGIALTK
jgi:hypothetical protein